MFFKKPIEEYIKKNGLAQSPYIKEAFTHKSAGGRDYERLEFLGDSVLGLCVTDFLLANHGGKEVGEFSKLKSYLVSKDVLFRIGEKNEIIKRIVTGGTLTRKDIKGNKKIISDVVESFIGAVYLAHGFERTKEFVNKLYKNEFSRLRSRKDFGDYKSELQMKALSVSGRLPEYRVVRSEGAEHAKTFHVEVKYNGNILGKGKGKTIKEAEQLAAKKALKSPKLKEEAR